MVDFIFVVIELFCYLLWLRRYKWKSVKVGIFQRGGSVWAQLSDGRGVPRQPLLVSEKQSDCPLMWYQIIRSALSGFVFLSQSTLETDRQTDRITTRKTALA